MNIFYWDRQGQKRIGSTGFRETNPPDIFYKDKTTIHIVTGKQIGRAHV